MAERASYVRVGLIAAAVAAIVTVAINNVRQYLGQDGASSVVESVPQRSNIEQTLRDFLVKNPEVLVDMQAELERRQLAEKKVLRIKAINENAAALFRSDMSLIAGNPDGDVTIVEFFDYNCGFCRRAFKHLRKLIDNDKNVRVVLKEYPIFGKQSEEAAMVAVAANNQGKYFELHAALLTSPGRATKRQALRMAEKIGLDMDRLKQDMDSSGVKKAIEETAQLAEKMGLRGTPFYLVGDRTIPGAPENLYELFVETVADVRKHGCLATC